MGKTPLELRDRPSTCPYGGTRGRTIKQPEPPFSRGWTFKPWPKGGVAKERAYDIPSQVTATWAPAITLDIIIINIIIIIIIMKLLLMGSSASAPNQGGARKRNRTGPQLRFQSRHLQEESQVNRGPLQRDPDQPKTPPDLYTIFLICMWVAAWSNPEGRNQPP